MISKFLLPWFGGGPIVWAVALVFFQVMLLLGYSYSHLLASKQPKTQLIIHGALILVSFGFLPIIPALSLKPENFDNPVFQILTVLFVSIGLPFFLVSSLSPLLQSWFAKLESKSPYPLYSLSNAASIFALVLYPFVFEPRLPLNTQAHVWSISYIFLSALVVVCLSTLYKALKGQKLDKAKVTTKFGNKKFWYWILLSATGTTLLVSVSTQITAEISPIPFLWIVPLALYLLSFVVTFHAKSFYNRKAFLGILLVLMGVYFLIVVLEDSYAITNQVLYYATLIFVACTICHGELNASKPDKEYLTSFYFAMSLGGAIGGIFSAIVAPMIFPLNFELPIAILITCCVLFFVLFKNKDLGFNTFNKGLVSSSLLVVVVFSLFGFVQSIKRDFKTSILNKRNFYGILRVYETDGQRQFIHGNTLHGFEVISEEKPQPTSYYGFKSGVGKAFASFPKEQELRVGLVGLGVGTVSSLADVNDYLRIYEIDKDVKYIAENYFRYLKSFEGQYEIVLGDARISLEKEESQNFDIIVLDAFSSDAIPVHLLTKEAFEVYERHLADNGIIAFHITNRHLKLEKVVQALAQEYDYQSWKVRENTHDDSFTNTWMVLSRNKYALEETPYYETDDYEEPSKMHLWTDDYSNLFLILDI